MAKKLLLLLIFSFPLLLFAQSAFSDCRIVFTKVQYLPSLKISNKAFEDSLKTILRSKGFPLNEKEIAYHFVVTDKSKIDDLIISSGNTGEENILKKAILQLADLWKPATQNGYEVCAYISLKIQFADNNVHIEIMQ